jgi:hypothetical protein
VDFTTTYIYSLRGQPSPLSTGKEKKYLIESAKNKVHEQTEQKQDKANKGVIIQRLEKDLQMAKEEELKLNADMVSLKTEQKLGRNKNKRNFDGS